MPSKLTVKEHLKNGALYHPVTGTSPQTEWKLRLLRNHSMSRQINDALKTRIGISQWFVCIGAPVLCILFALATYFGYIPLEQWLGNLSSIDGWTLPPIGLKEVFVFIAVVNGLTFLIRKKPFVF